MKKDIYWALRGSAITFIILVVNAVISHKIDGEPFNLRFDWSFWAFVIVGGFVLSRILKQRSIQPKD